MRQEIDSQCQVQRQQIIESLPKDLGEFMFLNMDFRIDIVLKAMKEGWVYGKAVPIRIGRKIQVWDIDIKDEKDNMVCKSRLTLAVIKKNDK